MTESKFPAGWDAKRVQDVIDHYENQTEDEQAQEIEDGLEQDGMIWIAIPKTIIDEVRALIAREQGA